MLSSEKEFLFHFGWDDFFESQIFDLVFFLAIRRDRHVRCFHSVSFARQDKVLVAEDRTVWKKRSIEARSKKRSKKGVI